MSTVLVLAYNILMEGLGLLQVDGGKILAVYDIMGSASCSYLEIVECFVELCVGLILVYSLSL